MKAKNIIFLLVTLFLHSGFVFAGPARDRIPAVETRTITDSYGRTVVIPVKIERAAAIASAARLLVYAGAADRLVGVSKLDQANDPGMPYTVVSAETFAKAAAVAPGGSNYTIFAEELITLKPDVIFCNYESMIEDAEATGIPVIGLQYDGIFDESIYASLVLTGKVMGTETRCAEVIAAMRGWQADLDRRTRDIPESEKPSVYTGGVGFRGPHGFEGSFAQYPPFTSIHAKNVVDETGGSGALLIDLEKVLVWNPDIIFLNPSNMNLVNENYAVNRQFYDGLKAVRNGRVYAQISYNYNSTNIEIAIADAYYAGKIIFPTEFSDVDVEAKADEIFTVMLGQPFYRALTESGQGFGRITVGEE
jgi:iron complex transport system substrate-binding protein